MLEVLGDDLLQHAQNEQETPAAQERIVHAEKKLQLVRGPVLHPCLDAEDDDEVRDQSREDLLRGRQQRLPGYIVRQLIRKLDRREMEAREQEIRERSHGGGRGRREEVDALNDFFDPANRRVVLGAGTRRLSTGRGVPAAHKCAPPPCTGAGASQNERAASGPPRRVGPPAASLRSRLHSLRPDIPTAWQDMCTSRVQSFLR